MYLNYTVGQIFLSLQNPQVPNNLELHFLLPLSWLHLLCSFAPMPASSPIEVCGDSPARAISRVGSKCFWLQPCLSLHNRVVIQLLQNQAPLKIIVKLIIHLLQWHAPGSWWAHEPLPPVKRETDIENVVWFIQVNFHTGCIEVKFTVLIWIQFTVAKV